MKIYYSILLFFFTLCTFSQEICNNGIDDNGNGLIDLRDPECACTPAPKKSLVPNFDFEEYSSCPNMMGQFYKVAPWMQGTMGTPSYYNKCGFVLPDLDMYPPDGFPPNDEPVFFPSGNGIAGAVMSSNIVENIKATLTTPIPAGAEAELNLKVCAIIYRNNPPNPYDKVIADLTPINLTIYGSPTVSNIPTFLGGTPVGPGSPWVELGNVPYDPKPNWQDVTINFTVPFVIKQIMIGGPEVMPEAYHVPFMHLGSYPYFLYDDVIINTADSGDLFIRKEGSLCSNDLTLTAVLNAPAAGNVVYQWYKGGYPVFINGASSVLDVSDGLYADKTGTYTVKVFDGTTCYENSYTVNTVIPMPRYIMTTAACETLGSILFTSPAEEYSINNGFSWSTNPLFEGLSYGYYYLLTRTAGCVSSPRTATMDEYPDNLPQPYILTTQPDSCADIGSIEVFDQSDYYSYDNGLTWTTSNTLVDVPAGDYLVLIKDETGCTSLPKTVTLTSYANNFAPPIGDAIQYFCVSEVSTVQSINADGNAIRWYDAPLDGNLLPNNTPLVDGQTYYASQTVNGCESKTRLEVTVIINTTLNADDYDTQICDIGNAGDEFIDLSDFDSYLTPSTSYFFHYFTTASGAETQNFDEEIINFRDFQIFGPTTVYVRVTNQGSCYKVVELKLDLLAPPVIPLKDRLPVCERKSIIVDAGAGHDTYLWSTGETTRTIIISQPGPYSVTVTKDHGKVTCDATKDFTVFLSNIATITDVEVSDWNQTENVITVILSPNSVGDYEYSLNGLSFQDSNVFTGLPGGLYTVYVKDKNGCGMTDDDFYVISFPKFFTPNADGYNDTWKIQFAQAGDQFITEIYDRYGKLLKKLRSNEGWDGTVDGTQMPTNDYWFKVTGNDGKELRGHFTLKR
ncbi:T9SS type B sorting domain-containing protein [Flavobacterium sp. PLA-1-15]|uniref:T9SS type B sorting domain-containing protein n=1 Tax=Flavobacterium sp. PLA-1-15 TaxID=3380533 RepID=UPI003B7DA18F